MQLIRILSDYNNKNIFVFQHDWKIIDPLCTFIFSVIVIFTTLSILKDALQVLMEGIPKGINFSEVMQIFLHIEGVKRVHNLRIWALSLDKIALSAHIAIGKYCFITITNRMFLLTFTKRVGCYAF